MSIPDVENELRDRSPDRRAVERDLKRTLLTGAAITVPIIITLLVLALVLDFLAGLVAPLVGVLDAMGVTGLLEGMLDAVGVNGGIEGALAQALALVSLVVVVFAVGAVAERRPADGGVTTSFDAAVERIPGVGSIYTSVNRMSEVLLRGDTQSFREVKLLEFPHSDTYSIAFLTARAPDTVERAAGHDDMLTLFVPLAPNPFMGGQLVTVPADRAHDLEMSVEEGIRAVVTSGVAIDEALQEVDDVEVDATDGVGVAETGGGAAESVDGDGERP
ncbi:MAG: DUF502 domain-containing protein [Halobacteriales archaeon]